MAGRKPLSLKTRFEVLKRDQFTCQYCGRSAPEVVLEVDHIVPVADGGDNSMFNLVTSCYECNHGKSKIRLDDVDSAEKQKMEIELFGQRVNKMEHLFNWKEECLRKDRELMKSAIKAVQTYFGREFDEPQKATICGYIKEYGAYRVIDIADLVAIRYKGGLYSSLDMAIKNIGHRCYLAAAEEGKTVKKIQIVVYKEDIEHLRENYGIEVRDGIDISAIYDPIESEMVDLLLELEKERECIDAQ